MTPTIPITRTPPTPRQAEVLECITAFIAEFGRAPTLGAIAARLSVTRCTVHQHVDELRRKGWLAEGRTIAVAGDAPAVPHGLLAEIVLTLDAHRCCRLAAELRRAMGGAA